jgi:tetraacyldisaccharide 4'-kinase
MAEIERYWYKIHAVHFILWPISWVFGALAYLRRLMFHYHIFRSYRLPVPVIIIGNINVGGTGKTPLTLYLAQQLREHGYHPLIISRGYGAKVQGQEVAPSHTAGQVGDEPRLMASRQICPVWVGADRVATAQTALQSHRECNIVLSDDGLQHYRLQRDIEIIVIDGIRRFGNGYLLPAGPLRESASRLTHSDAVVVNGGPASSDQFLMTLSGKTFYNIKHPEKTAIASDFTGLRIHAIAGIGHPQRFFDHLSVMGLKTQNHAFADHYAYRAEDLTFQACDALLMTEKDAVKCDAYADEKMWVLRVDAQIDPALISHLLRKITQHGCKTA